MLLDLSASRDWFDYIRDIITMIGYLATVGAFLYLFRRDNDKQKQIDSLSRLAFFEEEKLRLSLLPDLYKNGGMSSPGTREISFDLLNRGENARLISFSTTSEDIFLHSESLPYMLEKGGERLVFMRSKGKNTNECEYIVTITYEDKSKNIYELKVTGRGSHVSFGDAVLVKRFYQND